MAKRRELVKPDRLSDEEWEIVLRSERADLLNQLRRSAHTRGMDGGISRRIDLINAALVKVGNALGDGRLTPAIM